MRSRGFVLSGYPHMTDRIRGRRLQRIRAEHLAEHPLCVHCEARGIVREATELDHITALVNGGSDDGPKQGLCHECHEAKTRKDLGLTDLPTTGVDGWEVEGGSVQIFSKVSRTPLACNRRFANRKSLTR